MAPCIHILRFADKCGHTWDDVTHDDECMVTSVPESPYGMPTVDVHISRLYSPPAEGDDHCENVVVDKAILKGCCYFCYVKKGALVSKHPIGALSTEVVDSRRNLWYKLCYPTALGEMKAIRKNIKQAEEVRIQMISRKEELKQLLEKFELKHQERRQKRKTTWFAGLARHHNRQIEQGVPALKRTYIFTGIEDPTETKTGNIFQEVEPSSLVDEGNCGICRGPLTDTELRTAKLPCKHIYHLEEYCILRWFNDGHKDCPYCRALFEFKKLPDWNDPEYSEPTKEHPGRRHLRGYNRRLDDWPVEKNKDKDAAAVPLPSSPSLEAGNNDGEPPGVEPLPEASSSDDVVDAD